MCVSGGGGCTDARDRVDVYTYVYIYIYKCMYVCVSVYALVRIVVFAIRLVY